LIDFTRVRNRSLPRTLLEAGVVKIELPALGSDLPGRDRQLVLEPLRGEPQPASLAVYAGDQHIITVAAQDQADLSAILDTGLATIVEIVERDSRPMLTITLAATHRTLNPRARCTGQYTLRLHITAPAALLTEMALAPLRRQVI
jgi:hypothetical protein